MNKAQQLAEERYPFTKDKVLQNFVINAQRAAFIAGLQTGMEFAEWCSNNDLSFKHGSWEILEMWDNIHHYTTEELFEIFIKEKHGK